MPKSRGRKLTRRLKLERDARKRRSSRRLDFFGELRRMIYLHRDNGKGNTWKPTHRKVA
jgi:hypothetical protein